MFRLYALIGLGIYFALLLTTVLINDKNTNAYDFFFAERRLPFWALSITFVASWWGAGSAISTADLAFDEGIAAFFYYGFPVLVSTFIMIIGAKAIRKVGYLTQGEMMKARYSSAVAKLVALMNLIFMTFNASAQMVGIGMFFGYYLDISYFNAILLGTCIILIYSFFGGFRAVVLTDIIQFILLTLSALCIFGVAFYYSGGLENIAAVASSLNKPNYMNLSYGFNKHIMYIITFGCSWMIQANVWQRISASKTNSDARYMAILAFILFIPLYLMVAVTGMAGLTLFESIPEGGIISGIIKNYMSPVFGAFIFVGIAAAIMSTTDSLINTGAMTIILDLIPKNKAHNSLYQSRLATLAVSAVALLVSLKIRSILIISWVASDIITTGIFIPLVFGFFWRRGNTKGAIASMLWGLLYCSYNLCIQFGLNLPTFWTYGEISQVIFGVSISTLLYITISLLTPAEYEKANAYINKADLFTQQK